MSYMTEPSTSGSSVGFSEEDGGYQTDYPSSSPGSPSRKKAKVESLKQTHQSRKIVPHDPPPTRSSNHPRWATKLLKDWVATNVTHPYPTDDEKLALSMDTQLTELQVNNWFINERRRNWSKYPGADSALRNPNRNENRRMDSKGNEENQDPCLASSSGLNPGPSVENSARSVSISSSATRTFDDQNPCVASGSSVNRDPFMDNYPQLIGLALVACAVLELQEHHNTEGLSQDEWVRKSVYTGSFNSLTFP